MASHVPKDRIIDALAAEWANIDRLLVDLSDDEWARPTSLPGWDVQANVAHIVGTESFLLGLQPPVTVDASTLDHVRNPIGEMNENWIASYAGRTPADVLASFRELTGRRLGMLRVMDDDEWNHVGFTPAGEDTYGRFMRIRVFDCWMHEQDIRQAVGRPGHDAGPVVDVSLDEMATAMGFVVGKRAGAAEGSSVTFDLTGGSGRRIHVAVAGRAAVVDTLDGPATVTLRMPVLTFTRLAGGRADADPSGVEITGDEELGRRVLANLAYMI